MTVLDEPYLPSEIDAESVRNFCRKLTRGYSPSSRITIQKAGDEEAIEVPKPVYDVLMRVLSIMSENKAFTLMPIDSELTTQQAADLLNVSRPYLNKILDLDEIRHRKVGRNRRVKFSDLMEYKKQQEVKSKAALQSLVDEAQELGLGY